MLPARAGILLPHLEERDAVGNDAIGMAAALRARGIETRLFAPTHRYRREPVYTPRTMDSFLLGGSDLLIYHYAVYWPDASSILRNVRCRRVLKYHNVTPAHFFSSYEPAYEKLCREGRSGLADLVKSKLVDAYLADSKLNADELLGLGAESVVVVPPFHCVSELVSVEAEPSMLARLLPDAFGPQANLLMVGRVVPNKGHATLMRALALLQKRAGLRARLILVGREDRRLSKYSKELRGLAMELGVQNDVWFTGNLSPRQLKACYLGATALTIASQHEGFCVPAVEALALGVPVVAEGSTAVSETIAGHGLVWTPLGPETLAAAVEALLLEPSTAAELAARGQEHFWRAYSAGKVETRFLEALGL